MRSLLFFILSFTYLWSSQAQVDITDMCSSAKKAGFNKQNISQFRQTDNQHDYDVHYYGLDIELNPSQKRIEGEVSIGVLVIEDSINRIELDLTDNYIVEKTELSGNNIEFEHEDDLLILFLGGFSHNGTVLDILVKYSGIPGSNSFNFDTRNGHPMIWSLSEPYGARAWWPCKDYPFDKADSTMVKITVPEGLIAGSNGRLIEQNTQNGFTSFTWKESYPITTYLVSVAVHPYEIARDYFHYSDQDSMEVVHYIFPDHYEAVVEDYDKTIEMLEFYSSIFGLYPFINEKYGHAEFPRSGGMEHQTLTSILGPYEYLIAHELAHQWWGNMITCKDFHHIWLNEGFATYAEALWAEYKYGEEAYHDYMAGNAFFGEGSIYVPDLSNDGRIFSSSLSYKKASWVLHMLRHVVGDEAFFLILSSYGESTRKYGVATTAHFQTICESVSGIDLDYFFDQWIYEENHPAYAYDWSAEETEGKYVLDLTIAQDQAFPVFKMPIDVLIETEEGDTLIVLENEQSLQHYEMELPANPLSVILDPGNWILKKIISGRSQIKHDNNNIILSLSENGTLGFDKPNGNGNGLIFGQGAENHLYFGTAIVGIGLDYLSDTDMNTGESDFERRTGTSLFLEQETAYQRGILQYGDHATINPKSIAIKQESLSYSDYNENSIVFFYDILNEGDEVLDEVYFGVMLDLDIGYYLDNLVGISSEERLIYQENGITVGLKSLDYQYVENSQMVAIKNALDNFSGNGKIAYLKGSRNDFTEDEQNDWAILLSVGPFALNPGEKKIIPYALVAGNDRAEFIEASEEIQEFYDLFEDTEDLSTDESIIQVFPNPSKDKVYIKLKNLKATEIDLVIRDQMGRKVIQKTSTVTMDGHVESIELSDLPRGLYFLQCIIDKQVYIKRILKQ